MILQNVCVHTAELSMVVFLVEECRMRSDEVRLCCVFFENKVKIN